MVSRHAGQATHEHTAGGGAMPAAAFCVDQTTGAPVYQLYGTAAPAQYYGQAPAIRVTGEVVDVGD